MSSSIYDLGLRDRDGGLRDRDLRLRYPGHSERRRNCRLLAEDVPRRPERRPRLRWLCFARVLDDQRARFAAARHAPPQLPRSDGRVLPARQGSLRRRPAGPAGRGERTADRLRAAGRPDALRGPAGRWLLVWSRLRLRGDSTRHLGINRLWDRHTWLSAGARKTYRREGGRAAAEGGESAPRARAAPCRGFCWGG